MLTARGEYLRVQLGDSGRGSGAGRGRERPAAGRAIQPSGPGRNRVGPPLQSFAETRDHLPRVPARVRGHTVFSQVSCSCG